MTSLAQSGWAVETQPFVFKGVQGRNIVGKGGQGPVILLGAHYDTRPAADFDSDPARRQQWIDGANDGASGVAVLLELARVLNSEQLNHEVWLVFFDAEDRGLLQGWPFSVGASVMADNLSIEPVAVIVVDMVGDIDQTLFFEYNSDLGLQRELWAIGAELGYEAHFRPRFRHAVVDDHLPFAERGIRAITIIDFDYPYWHTTADTLDKISPASLERVGRTLEAWLKIRKR